MKTKREWSVLRFEPIYQERVWGGRRLQTLYGRELPCEGVRYGESWEICDRVEEQSVVVNGRLAGWTLHDLWVKARVEVFGAGLAGHGAERFPLLLKVLDAEDDLSIQVHPHDGNAVEVGGEAKSEAWYVAHAGVGAKLYAGLREGVTRESFVAAMAGGTVATQVQELAAVEGGCVAIGGGVMHAIGAGLVIFEIQQNSDTTYRVFDWNRVGLDGKPRELHEEAALRVTDFAAEPVKWQQREGEWLLDWPYFKLQEWELVVGQERVVPAGFVMGAVVVGEVEMDGEVLKAGDFFMVPAAMEEEGRRVRVNSSCAKVLWVMM